MAFVFSVIVFFIDHYYAGVSTKHCLLSFFHWFCHAVAILSLLKKKMKLSHDVNTNQSDLQLTSDSR